MTPSEAQALPLARVPLSLVKSGEGARGPLCCHCCSHSPCPHVTRPPPGAHEDPTPRRSKPAWETPPVSLRHLGSGLDLRAIASPARVLLWLLKGLAGDPVWPGAEVESRTVEPRGSERILPSTNITATSRGPVRSVLSEEGEVTLSGKIQLHPTIKCHLPTVNAQSL